MDRRRYSLKVAGLSLVTLMLCACVGKKPDDDVALIKQLLTKFERGLNQRSGAVLDSIIQDKRQNMASRLLDSLSLGKQLQGARIASKMFVIVKDSAEVRLRLGLRLSSEFTTDEEKEKEIEKPLKLFLNKKKGEWKIRNFSMVSEEEQ